MADHLESVKILAKSYRTWSAASRAKNDEAVADRHLGYASSLDAAISEIEELRRVTQPIPASYGDLSDLPAELLKELTGIKVDELEQQVFNIVKAGGEEVELDAILIELFRRHKVMQTRKFLQNKLWRMGQKGAVRSVEGKKGVYCIPEAKSASGWATPSKGGFADDLDDDIPF